MDFLEGETEARYAWATAARVACEERAALKITRRKELAEISRQMSVRLDAMANAFALPKNDSFLRFLDQMQEQQRAQSKAFERLCAPPNYTKLFESLGRVPDYTKLFANLGNVPNYTKLFENLSKVPDYGKILENLGKPPDYSKLFGKVGSSKLAF